MSRNPWDDDDGRVWALRHADGTWRAPDHFVSSRTSEARSAKPFYGPHGKHDAEGFQKLSNGSEVVPHPHPEVWGRKPHAV